jgi:hypothetical protein
MWAWQLWICLDSIYLFATWTLVSVVVGTTQIQSWSFFEQICSSVFQFTPLLGGFFWGKQGSLLLGIEEVQNFLDPLAIFQIPNVLHLACWSSCENYGSEIFPVEAHVTLWIWHSHSDRLTYRKEGGSLGQSLFHSTTVLTHRFWGIQKMSVRIYWGYT